MALPKVYAGLVLRGLQRVSVIMFYRSGNQQKQL